MTEKRSRSVAVNFIISGGIILSVIYSIWVAGTYAAYWKPGDFFEQQKFNIIGDFFSGICAPLALVWLVVAVLIQRQDLKESREQFLDSQMVIQKQIEYIEQQNDNAEKAAQRSAKIALFDPRMEIYKQLVKMRLTGRIDEEKLLPWIMQIEELTLHCKFLFGDDVVEWLDETRNFGWQLHDALNFQRHVTPATDGTFDMDAQYKNVNELNDVKNHCIGRVLNSFTDTTVNRKLFPYLSMRED